MSAQAESAGRPVASPTALRSDRDTPKSGPDTDATKLPTLPPARVDESKSDCVICCDTITDACEARPCAHRHFDYLCVATWLFADARCPVCRATVESLVRDSTGEALTNFQSSGPTLNVQSTPSSSSGFAPRYYDPDSAWGNRLPPVSLRRGARPRCRLRPSPHPIRPPTPSDAIRRRQQIYLHNRYSKHVGINRHSRYREVTPQVFRDDEEQVSRARMWIRRELQVFAFLNPDDASAADIAPPAGGEDATARRRRQNAEFLLEYIIAILKSVDLAGSAGEAENMLSDFLGRDNTRLFLHELRSWLRSPYMQLESWDREVQYEQEPRSGSVSSGSGQGRDRRQSGRHRHGASRSQGTTESSSNELTNTRTLERHQSEAHPLSRGGRDKRPRIYDRYIPSSSEGSRTRQ